MSENTLARKKPRVSIGMPVFNGEKFLQEALDSLLGQTFKDFELIVSDNGSNDGTEKLCRKYSAQDARIHYYRSDVNQGAKWNFNHVFELSVGQYFMWAAHDDLWHPEFLQKCVNVLDSNDKIVLCYSATQEIDGHGQKNCKEFCVKPELALPQVHKRFDASWRYPPQILVFGLMRREVLRKMNLIGNYPASDRVLVGELALAGQMYGIPEHMFYYRRHEQQSSGSSYPTMRLRYAWYDPAKPQRIVFPYWRVLWQYLKIITLAPIGVSERLLCYLSMIRWSIRKRRALLNELVLRDAEILRRTNITT